jgi:hypothetical protein
MRTHVLEQNQKGSAWLGMKGRVIMRLDCGIKPSALLSDYILLFQFWARLFSWPRLWGSRADIASRELWRLSSLLGEPLAACLEDPSLFQSLSHSLALSLCLSVSHSRPVQPRTTMNVLLPQQQQT